MALAIAWRMAAKKKGEKGKACHFWGIPRTGAPPPSPAVTAAEKRPHNAISRPRGGPNSPPPCAHRATSSAPFSLTVDLGHVSAPLHAQADVDVREAGLPEDEQRLHHLVAERLRLHQLKGGAWIGDAKLASQWVGGPRQRAGRRPRARGGMRLPWWDGKDRRFSLGFPGSP